MKSLLKKIATIGLISVMIFTMLPFVSGDYGVTYADSTVTYTWPGDPNKLYASGGSEGRWGDNVPGHKHSCHYGQDFSFSVSQLNILAAADGTVVETGYESEGYGHYVLIEHSNKQITLYGHLTAKSVSKGKKVTRGQKIGYITSGKSTGFVSGTCLHFGIYKNLQAKRNEYNGYKASQVSYDPLKLLVKCTKHTANTQTGKCKKCDMPYTDWDLKQEKSLWNTSVASNKVQFYRTASATVMRAYPKTGNKVTTFKQDAGLCVYGIKDGWYKVKDISGNIGYVAKIRVKKYAVKGKDYSKLKVTMNSSSYSDMTEGTSRLITGSVNSNYPLDYISVAIRQDGKSLSIKTHYFKDYIYKSATVSNSWKYVRELNLSKYSPGTYTVRIAARDVSGRAITVDKKLTIKKKSATPSTPSGTADGYVKGSTEYLIAQAKHYKGMTLAQVKEEIKAQGFNGYKPSYNDEWCAWYLSNCANASFVGDYSGISALTKNTYVDALANSFMKYNGTSKQYPSSYTPKAGDIVVEGNEAHIGIMVSAKQAAYGNDGGAHFSKTTVVIREPKNVSYYVPTADWYQIHYSDDLQSTSVEEDMAYNAPYKVKFGEKKKTSEKKFKRDGYDYSCYYIYQERYDKSTGKGVRYFWSKNTSTGDRGWIKTGTPNYEKVKIKVGTELWYGYRQNLAGAKVVLIPVWEKN